MQKLLINNILTKLRVSSSLIKQSQSLNFFWKRKKKQSQVKSWLKQQKITDQQIVIQNQHLQTHSPLTKFQRFQQNPNEYQLLDDFDLNYISTKLRSKNQSNQNIQQGALTLSSGQQSGKQEFLRSKGLTQEQMKQQLSEQRVRQILNSSSLNQRARRQLQANMRQFTDIYSIQEKMQQKSNKNKLSQDDLMFKDSLSFQSNKTAISNLQKKRQLRRNNNRKEEESKVQQYPYKFDAVEQSSELKNMLQYLKVPQDRKILPPQNQTDKGRITVFCELDQILAYIFLPDDTLGTMANPAIREADHQFIIDQFKQLTFVYRNDYLKEFLSLLDKEFEPILYTSSNRFLAEVVLQKIDAKNIFRHILDQRNCYYMEKSDEQISQMVKQIKKFIGPYRSMRSSILIDSNQFSCIFNPDNIIQVEPFRGDVHHFNNDLQIVAQHLMQIKKQYNETQDVRAYLEKEFMIRKVLQNAKIL